jgi:hypothetical protein
VIKVESNMLILDTSFSKQDAEAINHFVEIARVAERGRIIKLLEAKDCGDDFCIHNECIFALEIIELIQEEK